MEYPLCSPSLALADFWLFPKTKSAFKGQRFQDNENIKKNDGTERSSKTVSNSGSITGLSV
jgi:hypothetical protein